MKTFRILSAIVLLAATAAPPTTTAQTLTTIYSLGTNGAVVGEGGVLVEGCDGDFYDVGSDTNSQLCFYKVSTSGTLTELHAFNCANDGICSMFRNVILGSDGYFYGSSIPDFDGSTGAFYRVSSSGNETTIHWFIADGPAAGPLVQGSDGNFYGVSESSIFSISPTGTVTTLYTSTYTSGTYINTNWIFASLQPSDAFAYSICWNE